MLGTAVSLALIATPITRGDRGRRRRRCCSTSTSRRACCVGAVLASHGRRGDLRAAAQLDAAPAAGAHARGRVGPQRPGRRAAGARADRVHQAARLRLRRRAAAARAPARDRPRGRPRRRLARRSQAFRRAQLATAGLYPVASLAIAALAFGGADTLHGSGFLAVYLAGLDARLGARSPPSRRSPPSTRASAWVAQLGDVPHARPARLPVPARRHRARGHRARARGRGRRAAAGGDPGDAVRALQRGASGSCSAGPACAGRSRSCSRPSR